MFELCLHLGGGEILHPDHLVERLDIDQICDWRNFYLRRPFGQYREDLRQMVLIHYLLGCHVKLGGEPPNPIFPYFASDDELAAMAEYYMGLDKDEE